MGKEFFFFALAGGGSMAMAMAKREGFRVLFVCFALREKQTNGVLDSPSHRRIFIIQLQTFYGFM